MDEKKWLPYVSSEETEVLTAGVEKRAKLLCATLHGAMTPAMRQKDWSDVMWEVNVVDGFGRSKSILSAQDAFYVGCNI